MQKLQQAVGPGMPNIPVDVRLVDGWLYRWELALGQSPGLPSSQPVLAQHQQARRIESFQRQVLGDPCPTGIVKPGDRTAQRLEALPQSAPKHFPIRPARGPLLWNAPAGTELRLPPRTDPHVLDDDDYTAAAKELGCEMLAIKAVSLEEGKGQGFDSMGYPVILFEPLNFASSAGFPNGRGRFGQIYKRRYPELTFRQPAPHPYGPTNQVWRRLQMAYMLDPEDALKSTSWGRFQVKADNAKSMGYCSVEDFVSRMCASELEHLLAFAKYIRLSRLIDALRAKDWATFAYRYNGPRYRSRSFWVEGKNYAERIADRYDRLKAQ